MRCLLRADRLSALHINIPSSLFRLFRFRVSGWTSTAFKLMQRLHLWGPGVLMRSAG